MGNGIRARRRSNKTFVWGLYTIGKAIDESTDGTSGSVTLSSSRYKMAASAYTVSSTGTISLTNAEQKTAANIAVGDCLVNISTSSSTVTTGTTLYKVTSVTQSGTSYVVKYTAHTPIDAVGEDTGNRVESKTMDYPADGIHDGYWYVLLRGKTTIHVWNIYNRKTTYLYKENTRTASSYVKAKIYTNTYIYYSSSYTFDKKTGRYFLDNPTQLSSLTSISTLSSKYWVVASSISDNGNSSMYYGCTAIDWSGYGNSGYVTGTKNYSYEQDTSNPVYSQGTTTGKTAKSAGSTFYPQNGEYGGYWYVYSHSYEGYIDLT